MNKSRRHWQLWALIGLIGFVTACSPQWELELGSGDSVPGVIDSAAWRVIDRAIGAAERPEGAIPLERILWESGIPVVRELQLDGHTWYWQDIYDQSWLLEDGQVRVLDQIYAVTQLEAHATADAMDALDLIDLTPTIAGALGAASPEHTVGRALGALQGSRVVLVIIDGLSYDHHASLVGQGITPLLDSMGQPRRARSVYPSTPEGVLEAILTGAPSRMLAAEKAGRESLLETVSQTGKSARVISAVDLNALGLEGELDSFNSPVGSPDSELVAAAILDLQADIPSALLVVQLHDLASVIGDYGFQADETLAELKATDRWVHELLWASPEDTLFLVCASFGMHALEGHSGAAAGWGTLLPTDMLVPIWSTRI